jgi:VanZ family protein
MPAPPAAPSVVGWDKLQHAVAFGGLVLVTLPALAWAAPESQLRPRLLVATAISTLFGAVLELVQAFSPPRTADVLDWIADTVGALAVAGAVYAVAALAGRRQA